MAQTLFDKLWQAHQVSILTSGETLLLIDRIFLHERTGSIALLGLEESGRKIRSPERVFCTMDHIVDTFPGRTDDTLMPSGGDFIRATREAAQRANIKLYDLDNPDQGISHVIAAEQGIALPGLTLVCPDSHTCTLGGLGALAFGIGSTDAEHALATNTLRVKKPLNMQVTWQGLPAHGITAKDMILDLIRRHGANGASGHMVEFAGEAIEAMDIESRMTLCNMAVEFSAFSGIVAPDTKTMNYIADRSQGLSSDSLVSAQTAWKQLKSDGDATFDRVIKLDAGSIKPSVTWGTSPEHTIFLDQRVPDPAHQDDSKTASAMHRALDYMDLQPGDLLTDQAVDAAFIGSCTNARLSDLKMVADYLQGRQIAPGVKAVCVPGSGAVKRAAERVGIAATIQEAGFEWREPGCSMCFYAGGETFGRGKRVISSTNRNFEGRQGPGTRTHLASPLTVAASACAGYIRAAE